MNVLIACEESQAVCKEFRRLGHNAFSCDIIPCSGGHPEWHIQGDVLKILNPKSVTLPIGLSEGIFFETMDGKDHYIDGKWDLIIAFPPCTHLSSSGQWAYSKGKDISLKIEAIKFFMAFANADCEKIAIENPVGVMSSEWRKPNQIIHPWMFGDMASKQTCLWLKGIPNLIPSVNKKPEFEYHEWRDKRTGKTKRMEKWMYDIRCLSDRKKRAEIASKTFPGIARAMAEQWGGECK